MKLYHTSYYKNLDSIMSKGIVPSYSKGLLSTKDNCTYLTNSLKYIKIMAEQIAYWEKYIIFKVNVKEEDLKLIWWKGKGYKEWTTTKIIPPEDVKIFKKVTLTSQLQKDLDTIVVIKK